MPGTELVTVDFQGDLIFAIKDGEKLLIAVKPIVERLGVDWRSQQHRINRDAVLSEGRVVMTIPSPGGVQETVCLPLDLIPGFLFGIDDRRVKEGEVRDTVLRYKRECYRVLHEHFFGARVTEKPARRHSDLNIDDVLRFLHNHDARIYNAVIGRARANRAQATIWDLANDTGLSWQNCKRGVRLLAAVGLIDLFDEGGITAMPWERPRVLPFKPTEF